MAEVVASLLRSSRDLPSGDSLTWQRLSRVVLTWQYFLRQKLRQWRALGHVPIWMMTWQNLSRQTPGSSRRVHNYLLTWQDSLRQTPGSSRHLHNYLLTCQDLSRQMSGSSQHMHNYLLTCRICCDISQGCREIFPHAPQCFTDVAAFLTINVPQHCLSRECASRYCYRENAILVVKHTIHSETLFVTKNAVKITYFHGFVTFVYTCDLYSGK